jgi:NADPH2:quinone reductase
MRRVVQLELGSLDTLVVEEVEPLLPAAHQVVIDIQAAAATFVDALIAVGGYQIRPPTPYSPGGEVAGVVSAVGDEVTDLTVGDRVLAQCGMGGFADQVAVPRGAVLPIPDDLSTTRAATLVQSYATMVFAFTRRVLVQPGETVLVLGAGGAIGLAAIDVARALGLRPIAAASSEDKLMAAKAAGAEQAVDYSAGDLRAAIRELAGDGVDLVVDPVGGSYAQPALRSLGPGGRYLVVGFAGGEIPRLPANLVLLNNRAVIGVDWGAWATHDPALNQDLVRDVLEMAVDGRLHPPEPTTYRLVDAAAALRTFTDRTAVGKVALVP